MRAPKHQYARERYHGLWQTIPYHLQSQTVHWAQAGHAATPFMRDGRWFCASGGLAWPFYDMPSLTGTLFISLSYSSRSHTNTLQSTFLALIFLYSPRHPNSHHENINLTYVFFLFLFSPSLPLIRQRKHHGVLFQNDLLFRASPATSACSS